MIENQQVYITYTADGVQREWEFPYQYVKPEDISLYIEHDGVLTKVASQLYAFSEVTKKVTYPLDEEESPVPAGDSVLLWRETNITQEEDSSIANFKSNDLERMTDKLTMICQELSDKYNRAVHFEPTDVYDTDATTYVKTITEAKDTAVQAASDAHDEAVAAAGYASDASGSAVLANNYKNAASMSADESKKWAEGTDEEVTALGGEHSSKEWSNVAKHYAETIGAALVYKGSVSTYSNLPSSGQKTGDFWNVLDTGKNYAWTGSAWDDVSGIMDLSAYRTAAAQDIIDSGKQDTLVSGTNIKSINNNSLLGNGDLTIGSLPNQEGHGGKFLKTDGTDATWEFLDELPNQTGEAGRFLTTDGATASWAPVDALPNQAGNDGKFLTTDGTSASWTSINTPTVRNVGEIVPSILPLTDAGLHLLDGDLLSRGGSYDEFIDYIANLYSSGNYPSLFETEANWQSSVSTYGVCGKFVYDDVNGTVRLPKITGIIEGTINANALGDLVKAGLPNITGTVGTQNWQTTTIGPVQSIGALSGSNDSNSANTGGSGTGAGTLSFDASLSNPIYGNSSTVQPQTILGFYYIVVANSVKTEIQVDIDQIATDLNTRANTDLSNLTNIGQVEVAHLAAPSDVYVDLTLGVTGDTYTAPANGSVVIRKMPTASNQILSLYCVDNGLQQAVSSTSNNKEVAVTLSVKKGQTFGVWYELGGATQLFRFVYDEGSKSEA